MFRLSGWLLVALDPLLEAVRGSLLMAFLAMTAGGLVYISMTLVAEGLEVGPLEAEVTALLLGASGLNLDQVMDAAGRDYVALGLTAFTQWVGTELGGAEVSPLAAVHELDVELTVGHRDRS